MPNQKNIESVKKLEDRFKDYPNLLVTNYQGLTTPELNDLRAKLKPLGCEYGIVKNSLTQIALKNIGLEDFAKHFSGPTAVAFQKGDPSSLSKVIVDFAKSNEKLKILVGCLAGKIFTEKEIRTLATLPSRQVLLRHVAVALIMPIQKAATVLNAPIVKLALILKALEQQKAKAA